MMQLMVLGAGDQGSAGEQPAGPAGRSGSTADSAATGAATGAATSAATSAATGAAGGAAGAPPSRSPEVWLTEVREQVHAVDQAVYDAVADTPTPNLDAFVVGVSKAADYSRLWMATAAVMAVAGGSRGRRAAGVGMLAIGMASAVSNLALKPLTRRNRPMRSDSLEVSDSRRVRRPVSASFPSGHTASAFAFASAAGEMEPRAWVPLHLAAAAVGYSRVHTGVHYPSDVAAGAAVGALCGWTVRRFAGRRMGLRRPS